MGSCKDVGMRYAARVHEGRGGSIKGEAWPNQSDMIHCCLCLSVCVCGTDGASGWLGTFSGESSGRDA